MYVFKLAVGLTEQISYRPDRPLILSRTGDMVIAHNLCLHSLLKLHSSSRTG